MPDVWIRLDAASRRRNWWWSGFLTVLFAGMAAIPASRPDPDPWWYIAVIGVCWLAAFIYMVNRCYGRTLLTAEGMEFHTFFSRRKIRWTDITRIEQRSHRVRGGEWIDVHAVRARGLSLRIPGVHTTRAKDADFDRKLRRIRTYWTSATQAVPG